VVFTIHTFLVVTFYCCLGFKNLKRRDKVFVGGVLAAVVVDVAGATGAAVLMCGEQCTIML